MLRNAQICLGSQKDSILVIGLLLISCEIGNVLSFLKIRVMTVLKTLSDLIVEDLMPMFYLSEDPQANVIFILTLGVSQLDCFLFASSRIWYFLNQCLG